MAEKSNRLCSNPTEVIISSSSPITPLSVETVPSNTSHPDAQAPPPALDPNSPTRTSQDGRSSLPPLRSRIFSWTGDKVDSVLKWIRTPTVWNLGLTFFSAIFAISFGIFTILAWVVAIEANRKADLAILIAKYQYKLDEYNTNLTIFAAKLAMQSRDDGRLSNRLQYYALCMSNSVSWKLILHLLHQLFNHFFFFFFFFYFTNNEILSTKKKPDFISQPLQPSHPRINRINRIIRNRLQQHIPTGNGTFARSHRTTIRFRPTQQTTEIVGRRTFKSSV